VRPSLSEGLTIITVADTIENCHKPAADYKLNQVHVENCSFSPHPQPLFRRARGAGKAFKVPLLWATVYTQVFWSSLNWAHSFKFGASYRVRVWGIIQGQKRSRLSWFFPQAQNCVRFSQVFNVDNDPQTLIRQQAPNSELSELGLIPPNPP